MESLVQIGFVLVVVAILVGAITAYWWTVRSTWRTSKEHQQLREFAAQRGWSYESSQRGLADHYMGEPFPDASYNIELWDVINGTYRGRPFRCFEFRTRTNVGTGTPVAKRKRTGNRAPEYYFRIFVLGLPAQLPILQVKRSRVGNKILNAVGAGDIKTGQEDFDKKFRVTGDHEQFARDVLNPHFTNWLLHDPRADRMPFRFERNELLTWQPARLKADSIEPSLDYLCDVLDRVPQHVWQ